MSFNKETKQTYTYDEKYVEKWIYSNTDNKFSSEYFILSLLIELFQLRN